MESGIIRDDDSLGNRKSWRRPSQAYSMGVITSVPLDDHSDQSEADQEHLQESESQNQGRRTRDETRNGLIAAITAIEARHQAMATRRTGEDGKRPDISAPGLQRS